MKIPDGGRPRTVGDVGRATGGVGKLGIRGWQQLHARRQRLGHATIGDGDVQPAGGAVEHIAKIQIHGEKTVDQRQLVRAAAADLIATGRGAVECEDHRVSAVGIRAAVVQLALIRECGRSLSQSGREAGAKSER